MSMSKRLPVSLTAYLAVIGAASGLLQQVAIATPTSSHGSVAGTSPGTFSETVTHPSAASEASEASPIQPNPGLDQLSSEQLLGQSDAIGIGSRGPMVTQLQTTLREAGYTLRVDGIFGNETHAVVTQFQEQAGLKADGRVETQTWQALLQTIQESSAAQPIVVTPVSSPASTAATNPDLSTPNGSVTEAIAPPDVLLAEAMPSVAANVPATTTAREGNGSSWAIGGGSLLAIAILVGLIATRLRGMRVIQVPLPSGAAAQGGSETPDIPSVTSPNTYTQVAARMTTSSPVNQQATSQATHRTTPAPKQTASARNQARRHLAFQGERQQLSGQSQGGQSQTDFQITSSLTAPTENSANCLVELASQQPTPLNVQPVAESPGAIATVPSAQLAKPDLGLEFIQQLTSTEPGTRHRAIWELGRWGDSRAIEPLVDLLATSDSHQRNLILSAVSEIGVRSLKPVHRALSLSMSDSSPDVRKNAIRDMTHVFTLVSQMSQVLRFATDDDDPEVRATAQWAIAQLKHLCCDGLNEFTSKSPATSTTSN